MRTFCFEMFAHRNKDNIYKTYVNLAENRKKVEENYAYSVLISYKIINIMSHRDMVERSFFSF